MVVTKCCDQLGPKCSFNKKFIVLKATDKPVIYYWINGNSASLFQPAEITKTLSLPPNAGVTYLD